jgi:Lrp/AsnC family transcriptional regulator
MPDELDSYERKILRELQRDASQTTAQIAEKVGLSSSPCWRRIERLEREGFIKARVAIIDRRKVGLKALEGSWLLAHCCPPPQTGR